MDSANREIVKVDRKDCVMVMHQAVSIAILRADGGWKQLNWDLDWRTNAVL